MLYITSSLVPASPYLDKHNLLSQCSILNSTVHISPFRKTQFNSHILHLEKKYHLCHHIPPYEPSHTPLRQHIPLWATSYALIHHVPLWAATYPFELPHTPLSHHISLQSYATSTCIGPLSHAPQTIPSHTTSTTVLSNHCYRSEAAHSLFCPRFFPFFFVIPLLLGCNFWKIMTM
jgi:hypothetical protein